MSKLVVKIRDNDRNFPHCPLQHEGYCHLPQTHYQKANALYMIECLGRIDKRPPWCPLKEEKKAIPIEWLHSIMERQLIFAMNSEMEGTTTVKDGVIHCVSGALACQVLANVIELWEKENEKDV